MAQPVSVALCFDRHLALPAAIVVASVMRSCSRPIHFHLIIAASPGLEDFLRGALAHYGADGTIMTAAPERELGADGNGPYGVPSTSTYRRLFLAELLPKLDRLIYLDSDLIVRHDLAQLWTQALGGRPLGAVADGWAAGNEAMQKRFPRGYFNGGVLLMDLASWRDRGLGQRLAEAARASLAGGDRASEQYDQGPLNVVLDGNWQSLSPRWNFTAHLTNAAAARLGLAPEELDAIRNDPGIVHFVGGYKPWTADFAQLSRYHVEFSRLRAALERDLDLAGLAWPGRYVAPAADRRRRRLLALLLVQRARESGRRRWVVVAKGLLALDVLSVAREQGLDIAGVATENPLFSEGQFGDFEIRTVTDQIRRGYREFLVADYRTASATAAHIRETAATFGADVHVLM